MFNTMASARTRSLRGTTVEGVPATGVSLVEAG
jgi:hypothetical protein